MKSAGLLVCPLFHPSSLIGSPPPSHRKKAGLILVLYIPSLASSLLWTHEKGVRLEKTRQGGFASFQTGLWARGGWRGVLANHGIERNRANKDIITGFSWLYLNPYEPCFEGIEPVLPGWLSVFRQTMSFCRWGRLWACHSHTRGHHIKIPSVIACSFHQTLGY